jgi:hypothetical protein
MITLPASSSCALSCLINSTVLLAKDEAASDALLVASDDPVAVEAGVILAVAESSVDALSNWAPRDASMDCQLDRKLGGDATVDATELEVVEPASLALCPFP